MKKLTLNKPLSPETQEKLLKLKVLSEKNAKMSDQEKTDRAKAKELFNKTKTWIESTYPDAFNFNNPKPLKIGVRKELLLVSSPYSKRQVNKCLGVYCSTKAYLEAIILGEWRYDLNGAQVEPITQEQKDHAAKQLAERKKKFRNKKVRHYSRRILRNVDEGSKQGDKSRGQLSQP